MYKMLFSALLVLLVFSCSKEPTIDPCAGIVCENLGTCVNGVCDCREGFGGLDCSEILTPQKVTLVNVQIVNYSPTRPDGTSWDGIGEHDPVLKIYSNVDVELWSSDIRLNVPYTVPFLYRPNFEFPNPASTFRIRFIDDDGILGSEQMMGFSFTARSTLGTYTELKTLDDANGGEMFLTFNIEY